MRELSAFSPCGEFFVCNNDAGILTIWETASNNVKQECNINTHLNTTCSSLIWGSFENIVIDSLDEKKGNQLLIIGTENGNVYLYDYCTGKLCNHFYSEHTDVVNDLSLDLKTNRLFTCSSDKSVIIWDITSGKLIKKWNAGDEELYSLCVVDSNNLLTGSTSVLWWNVKKQCIIKKFSLQEAPIIHLHVVNSADIDVTYFLAAADGESKISAWALTETNSKGAAASFILPDEILNIDTNNCFSKDNPLLLTAATKKGELVLFQHVLNGKTKKLTPQMTLRVMSKASRDDSKASSIPVISSKILDCAESCIIAYGTNTNPIFESVNIFDCPKTLTLSRENPLSPKIHSTVSPEVRLSKKLNEISVVNGRTSPTDTLYTTPKRRKHKETSIETIHNLPEESDKEIAIISSDNRISKKSSSNVKKKHKVSEKLQKNSSKAVSNSEDTVHTDPSEMVDSLIRGIEEEQAALINSVLHCDDSELIRSSIRNFPLHSLNLLLLELYRRLILQEKRYHSSVRKWLKEILTIHLPYLITCKDLTDILDKIRQHIDTSKVGETLLKMNMLQGLLKVQIQTLTSGESDSSSSESDLEELMES